MTSFIGKTLFQVMQIVREQFKLVPETQLLKVSSNCSYKKEKSLLVLLLEHKGRLSLF